MTRATNTAHARAPALHAPAEMTLEAWAAMDEDEPGELVDGFLEEEEVATLRHEAVVSWAVGTLRFWVVPLGGWVFGSETKLAVATKRGRKPDVSVFLPNALTTAASAALVRQPPSVVVEVISPLPRDGRRDRIDKLSDYAAFGVGYYWLIDPQNRTLEILELGGRRRTPRLVLAASEGAHDVPGCSGLRVDLDALWAEVDRLPNDPELASRPRRTRKRARRPQRRKK